MTGFLNSIAEPSFFDFVSLPMLGIMVIAAAVWVIAPACYFIAGKRRAETVARALQVRVGLALLTGMGVLLAVGLVLFVSSLMGLPRWPVSVLVSLFVWLTVAIGYTGISLWVTDLVAPGSSSWGWVMLGGGLVTVSQVVPIVGPIFLAFFVTLALGSAALSGYGTATDWLWHRMFRRPGSPAIPS